MMPVHDICPAVSLLYHHPSKPQGKGCNGFKVRPKCAVCVFKEDPPSSSNVLYPSPFIVPLETKKTPIAAMDAMLA